MCPVKFTVTKAHVYIYMTSAWIYVVVLHSGILEKKIQQKHSSTTFGFELLYINQSE